MNRCVTQLLMFYIIPNGYTLLNNNFSTRSLLYYEYEEISKAIKLDNQNIPANSHPW